VDKYAAEVARPRAVAVLAFAFALTALVASATGLFGLLSRSVARRRREFGIRAALGAPPSALRYLVWREGLTVTLSGMAIGTVAGLWVAQALSRLLFEVGSADPASWALVMGGLAATMAAASWRPARIASRAPLSVLLREE
jgi:ABC-type antimicrobial peptide transport system permease subunit